MDDTFLFTRGFAFGLVVLLCIKTSRDYRQLLTGRLLLMLQVCLGVYVLMPFLGSMPLLFHLMMVPAALVSPLFWLFALSLFQDWDRKGLAVGWHRQAVIALFLVVSYSTYWLNLEGSAGSQAPGSPEHPVLFFLSYLFRIAFLVLALAAVMVQWKQDLVETRRRLRSVMILVVGVFILGVLLVELMLRGEAAPRLLEVGHSIALDLLLLAVCSVLLLGREDFLLVSMQLVGPAPSPAVSSADAVAVVQAGEERPDRDQPLTATEQGWLAALQQHMERDFGYRNCELTIRKLGAELSIPEHHLRRLINRHLGYRNFNDYLNRYRIAEAAGRLVDPEQERLPILTIALEVGYASLPPFNRAFKLLHQLTPGEYRKIKLSSDSAL